jgi:hypothetical protein
MHEVQTFLQQAWAETESVRIAKETAAERARIAKEVEDLQRKIASENDAIAREWKPVGLAIAAEAGLFLVVIVCGTLTNASSGFIHWLLMVLGLLAWGLGFFIGLVILAGMVLVALFNTIRPLHSIAKLNAEIKTRQAGHDDISI